MSATARLSVRTLAAFVGVIVLLGASVLVASPANAGFAFDPPIVVETTADTLGEADLSLRDAIDVARSAGSVDHDVVLQAGETYRLDRCGDGSDPNEDGDLVFDEGGILQLRTEPVGGLVATIEQTCDGERVLTRSTGGSVWLQDVAITGGDASGAGGGVRAEGTIRGTRTIVEGNAATGNGGGLYAEDEVRLFQSVVSDNVSLGSGGGVAVPIPFGAGVVHLEQSTVSGNTAVAGGGGGVIAGEAFVDRSTIAANVANGSGGGLNAGSNGVSIVQSTITGNDQRGEDSAGGGVSSTGPTAIVLSTLVANSSSQGANLFASSSEGTSFLGAVLAQPGRGASCLITLGAVVASLSLDTDESCMGDPESVITHPMLAPLADAGGPTPTRVPVPPSPLIDALTDEEFDPVDICEAVTDDQLVDQRGADRPVGDACDIGSVEADPTPCVQGFSDVSVTHPFFEEICWMDGVGITTGFDDGTYRPSAPVSRQAMSAFMYRWAGSYPFTAPGTATFSDVGGLHPFFAEVEWMSETGVTNGFGDGTYRPSAPVSRQAMSAFLYRLAGEPDFTAPAQATFSDVGILHPFFEEIEWMSEVEVTTGFGDGTYRPSAPVSRQAMSAFLLRLASLSI